MNRIWTLLVVFALLLGGGVFAPDAGANPAGVPGPRVHRAPSAQVSVQIHVRMAKRQQNQARAAYRRGEIQSFAAIRRIVSMI